MKAIANKINPQEILSRMKPRDGLMHCLSFMRSHMFVNEKDMEEVLYQVQLLGYEIIDVKISSAGWFNVCSMVIFYR